MKIFIKALNEVKKKLAEFKSLSSKIISVDLLIRNNADKDLECIKLKDELKAKTK